MDLCISSLGMISSVGWDAKTTCASIRAGITRPSIIENFSVYNPAEEDNESISGHPIQNHTDGLFLTAVWIRLAFAAISDLMSDSQVADASDTVYWQRTGVIGITPLARSARFGTEETGDDEQIKAAFLMPLFDMMGLPVNTQNMALCCEGNAGIITALNQTREWLLAGRVDRVVIIGVDSYLDPLTLDWLENSNRLKCTRQPSGLSPGEAAACVLIESRESCVKKSLTPVVCIAGFESDFEPNNLDSDKKNMGEALSRVWGEVLALLDRPYSGLVLVDLNGELWRAGALANAQVRLHESLGTDVYFQSFAESLGEIGAASGVVGLCMAARSFARGYSYMPHMMILTNSEHGLVGAMFLRFE